MASALIHPFHFFGIRFWNAKTDHLLQEMDRRGGMLAVPSAPSLAQAAEDPFLIRAYQSADWAVIDGGYVAIIIRAMGHRVRRISGLQLIERLIAPADDSPIPLRERKVLWVVPDEAEEDRIKNFTAAQGFAVHNQSYYRAPFYQNEEEFRDSTLIALAAAIQPDWIVLCLGGGRQEKVGYHLRIETNGAARRPAILCTGAAIAFFTGGQAAIPTWADRLYLGWFLRVLREPKVYAPRYFKAAWHMPMALWHFRGNWFKESPAYEPVSDEQHGTAI